MATAGNVNKLTVIGGDINTNNPSNNLSFRIVGGAGGTGQNTSAGGAGGSLNAISILIDDTDEGGLVLLGGAGGSGNKGGAGGAIKGATLTAGTVNGDTPNFTMRAGRGGDGSDAGGKGGELSAVTATLTDINDSDTTAYDGVAILASGDGGNVTGTKGSGGQAGNIAKASLAIKGAVESSVQITAGKSGDSVATKSLKGGQLQGVTLLTYGHVYGSVNIASGAGGRVTSGAGLTGNGGDLAGVAYTSLGPIDVVGDDRPPAQRAALAELAPAAAPTAAMSAASPSTALAKSWAPPRSSPARAATPRAPATAASPATSPPSRSMTMEPPDVYVSPGAGGNGTGAGSKGGNTGALARSRSTAWPALSASDAPRQRRTPAAATHSAAMAARSAA